MSAYWLSVYSLENCYLTQQCRHGLLGILYCNTKLTCLLLCILHSVLVRHLEGRSKVSVVTHFKSRTTGEILAKFDKHCAVGDHPRVILLYGS